MMLIGLSPHAVKAGYRVKSFNHVDSTNILAAEFARRGDLGSLWIVADEQTAGRARRGRNWISVSGNLYTTLLLVDDFDPEQAATLGFVAGVSLIEAFSLIVPKTILATHPVRLKWPNDVLANEAKLSGILLEFVPLVGEKYAIVIGIGINVAGSPADLSYSATSLQQIGASCSSADVFKALSHFWVDNYRIWNHGAGLEVIRNKWLHHAANIGQHVHIMVNGEIISGTFETIDSNCHFILLRDDGKKIDIPAGDVYFGTVASSSACS
ncbi:MAG: biotin operon repressor / biotin-[acetyl-CoA-carboxylase] ligase [Candidatus Tokpelaia sp. JSC189]|nr:MAG: biotin operon repressor / biotin-[acetyl-CoA-carboxylase] ligase [Candidatus Tokpelaia sp. JSC189]